MISLILLIGFCGLLLLGALQDLTSLRISNWISVAVFLVSLISVAMQVHPSPWWEHILAFTLTLAGGMLLFSRGWAGGGDVKLLAAAAMWFDLEGLAVYLLAVAMIGGIAAFLIIGLRMTVLGGGIAKAGLSGARRSAAVPYGVPIAAAAIGLALLAANEAGVFSAFAQSRPAMDISDG